MTQLPTSQHFSLHELSEGVYAAVHAPGGWAICNAGIIDTGDRTLIFDAFTSPRATRDLLAAAKALTGRPAHIVMNSHYHNDHIWGNQAVPLDIDIISTVRTRDLMVVEGAREEQSYRENATQRLSETRTRLEHASAESEIVDAQLFVDNYEAIVDTLPMLPARLPNILIQDVLEFTGPKRRARFIPSSGHTASDAILHLPDDDVLFLGDLLFVHAHPYLGDGHPDELCQALALIKELNAGILVPGHGPLGRNEDVDAMRAYIDGIQVSVRQAIRDGVTWEELTTRPIPPDYRTWILADFYAENIRFFYQLNSTA